VQIVMTVEPQPGGGRLTIEVGDSGAGFDVARELARAMTAHRLSGRGLNMVRRLSQGAEWLDGGRCARVMFFW